MKVNWFFLILLTMSFVACSPQYSYFTQNLYEKQKWTQEDVQRIQFYVSKDIVLSRSLTEGEASISEGKIRIKNGRKFEQVIIKAGTPGLLVMMPKEDRFAISFEEDNEAYLMFGPNPKMDNHFALLAQNWERDNGTIHYKDNVYHVNAQSAYASLMVDIKKTGENVYQSRKVSGRLVNK